MRVLNQEGLEISRIPCLKSANFFPFVDLNWIMVTNTDSKATDHAGEELEVGKDDSIDEDVVTQFDDEELAFGAAFEEHVRVFVLD